MVGGMGVNIEQGEAPLNHNNINSTHLVSSRLLTPFSQYFNVESLDFTCKTNHA